MVLVGAGSAAWANGAFPDSEKLLLPADRPGEIVLSTNFGLVLSEDAGVTWTWTCEQPPSSGASLYALGAPPGDRIFAVGPPGLGHSDDGGCSWQLQTLDPAQGGIVDAFPDPADARRIYEILSVSGSRTVPDRMFLSEDGGETLGRLLFTAPLGATLTSVESARSDPRTIYVAFGSPVAAADYPLVDPVLARSTDGGLSWVTHDVTAGVGANLFRIIEVDPLDPSTLYLRSLDAFGERLSITRDGGLTFTTPVTVPNGELTAFARLARGTVLVSAIVGSSPVGFRSSDGAATFEPWPDLPNLRDLAERDGKLYAATDNLYESDWAVAVSLDEGVSFQPLMAYDQVQTVRACAAMACNDSCLSEAAVSLWSARVCAPAPDGSASIHGETPDSSAGDAQPAASGTPHTAGGCGCDVGSHARGVPVDRSILGQFGFACLFLQVLARRRRRRNRPCAEQTRMLFSSGGIESGPRSSSSSVDRGVGRGSAGRDFPGRILLQRWIDGLLRGLSDELRVRGQLCSLWDDLQKAEGLRVHQSRSGGELGAGSRFSRHIGPDGVSSPADAAR